MKNQTVNIYNDGNVVLDAEIKGDSLTIISNVFGEMDSEKTYSFSREETAELFEIIPFEGLIELCKEKGMCGLEEFLEENKIVPKTFTWVD